MVPPASNSSSVGGDEPLPNFLTNASSKESSLKLAKTAVRPSRQSQELPIAKHVRRHCWTDHVEGLLQPLYGRTVRAPYSSPRRVTARAEVAGWELLNSEPLTLMLEPSTERELEWLEDRRVLEQSPHRPMKLPPGEVLERLGERNANLAAMCPQDAQCHSEWNVLDLPREGGGGSRALPRDQLALAPRYPWSSRVRTSGHSGSEDQRLQTRQP